MAPIDILAIQQQARALRAQESQRSDGLFVEQLRVYALLGKGLLSLPKVLAETLRLAFSWHPQNHHHC